jgi:hypothetical protein
MGKRCGLYYDNAFRERKPPHEYPSPRTPVDFRTVKIAIVAIGLSDCQAITRRRPQKSALKLGLH